MSGRRAAGSSEPSGDEPSVSYSVATETTASTGSRDSSDNEGPEDQLAWLSDSATDDGWDATKPRSKRRRRKRTRRVNKSITREHPEFELTFDMMLGIRTTVGKIEATRLPTIELRHFREVATLRFDHEGSSNTPAHQGKDFKFKDYAPQCFRAIRRRFHVEPAEYLLRLCGDFLFLEFVSNSKSGQFFFYSHDRQYMIKTVTKDESKFLRRILPQYYKHVMNEKHTLLCRMYGMHRVKLHKKKAYYFLIMHSVFDTGYHIHEVFDLKGSSVGRAATAQEKRQPVPVLKDLDWRDGAKSLCLGPDRASLLKDQIRRDCYLLESLNIMDYSLLLGIHHTDRPVPDDDDDAAAAAAAALEGAGILPRRPSRLSPITEEKNAGPKSSTLSAARGGARVSSSSIKDADDAAAVAAAFARPSVPRGPAARARSRSQLAQAAAGSVQLDESALGGGASGPEDPSRSHESDSASGGLGLSAVARPPEDSSGPTTTRTTREFAPAHGTPDAVLRLPTTPMQVEVTDSWNDLDPHHAPRVRVLSSQTNYGLKRNYQHLSSPFAHQFTANDINPLANLPKHLQFNPDVPEEWHRKGVKPLFHSTAAESGTLSGGAIGVRPELSMFQQDDGGCRGADEQGTFNNQIYFFGVIDILQAYNARKKGEHLLKTTVAQLDPFTISSVPPQLYAARFRRFLDESIM